MFFISCIETCYCVFSHIAGRRHCKLQVILKHEHHGGRNISPQYIVKWNSFLIYIFESIFHTEFYPLWPTDALTRRCQVGHYINYPWHTGPSGINCSWIINKIYWNRIIIDERIYWHFLQEIVFENVCKKSNNSHCAHTAVLFTYNRDNKVHGANMGPTWVLSAPDRPPCYQGIYAISQRVVH